MSNAQTVNFFLFVLGVVNKFISTNKEREFSVVISVTQDEEDLPNIICLIGSEMSNRYVNNTVNIIVDNISCDILVLNIHHTTKNITFPSEA